MESVSDIVGHIFIYYLVQVAISFAFEGIGTVFNAVIEYFRSSKGGSKEYLIDEKKMDETDSTDEATPLIELKRLPQEEESKKALPFEEEQESNVGSELTLKQRLLLLKEQRLEQEVELLKNINEIIQQKLRHDDKDFAVLPLNLNFTKLLNDL